MKKTFKLICNVVFCMTLCCGLPSCGDPTEDLPTDLPNDDNKEDGKDDKEGDKTDEENNKEEEDKKEEDNKEEDNNEETSQKQQNQKLLAGLWIATSTITQNSDDCVIYHFTSDGEYVVYNGSKYNIKDGVLTMKFMTKYSKYKYTLTAKDSVMIKTDTERNYRITKLNDTDLNLTYGTTGTRTSTYSRLKEVVWYYEPNGREYVDLGLPSGTLWATDNLYLNSTYETGAHIAWGELKQKYGNYTWENYSLCNGTQTTLTRYCTEKGMGNLDNLKELTKSDDAAADKLRGNWRTPSKKQVNELLNSNYTRVRYIDALPGLQVTSLSNNAVITLPPTGYTGPNGVMEKTTGGYYWTRDLSTSTVSAYCFRFGNTTSSVNTMGRFNGLCIRPVLERIECRIK